MDGLEPKHPRKIYIGSSVFAFPLTSSISMYSGDNALFNPWMVLI